MHDYYIINKVIEFHPVTGTLRDINDSSNIVVLSSPASRCLLLLIERAGSVVNQHEFLEFVWTKSGMQVSINTFYQSISILRKRLKQVGLDEDMIVTISRIGLTLAHGTSIKKLTMEQEDGISHVPYDGVVCDESLPGKKVNVLHPFEPTDGVDTVITDERASVPLELPGIELKSIYFYPLSVLTGILLILILLAGYISTVYDAESKSQYFSHYDFLKNSEGCHIFLSDSIVTDEQRSTALRRVSQFLESCTNYPWVYVTHFPQVPRTSVIRCDKQMNEMNSCVSDYFFEDK